MPRTWRRVVALGGLALLVAGSAGAAPALDDAESDPWQGFNRGVFTFNEWLDIHVLMPVAKGWDFVVPEVAQTGIENFFDNLEMSVVLVNDLLQAKPLSMAEDVGRIVVNSTVGIAGLFDVATKIGIDENDEDFGQTLGYLGVPPGPFLMLPIFGPSSPRDTLGLAVDSGSRPWTWFAPWYATLPASATDLLNRRAIHLEDIDEARAASLDYYVFQRNAWVQRRALDVADLEELPQEDQEDLYYFDEEDE